MKQSKDLYLLRLFARKIGFTYESLALRLKHSFKDNY